jgi:LysR family transcriptional regulator, low CO2-responsive transcriptional regulator
VTLAQLKVFVLVARLGSVKAAATALGVSEPAVSQALAALRMHLGDPLLAKSGSGSGSGMELTDAGRRVVGIASQMVSLATDAETAVRHSQGAPELLRIVATSTIAESVGPSLLQAFSAKAGNVELTLGVSSTEEIEALLYERLVDVALGPKVPSSPDVPLDSEALLRYRLVFVASARHPLASGSSLAASMLASQRWLVDPSGADPMSDVGKVIARLQIPATQVQVFQNSSAAYAAAARGEGIAPAVDHLVAAEVAKGDLVRLDVVDTPISLLWHVTSRADDRRPPMVSRFRRFLTTPDAMHAMHRVDGSVPATRFRPPVHVTIWS